MFDFLAFLTLLVVVGKQQSEQEGDDHEAQAHKYWYSNVVVLALLAEFVGERGRDDCVEGTSHFRETDTDAQDDLG